MAGRSGVTTSASPASSATTGSHMVWSRPTPCSSTSVGLVIRCTLLGRQRGQPLGASLSGGGEPPRSRRRAGRRRSAPPLSGGGSGWRGVGDVLERDVEQHAGGARFSDGGRQGGGVGRLAEVVTELEGVDQPEPCSTSPSSPTMAALPYASAGPPAPPAPGARAARRGRRPWRQCPGSRSSTNPWPPRVSITAATTATRAGG